MNLTRHTAVLWRGPGSVQVGGDRCRRIFLDHLHAGDQIWLSGQARAARAREGTQPSPELLAALADADLVEHPDRRPHLSVGVFGAVPAAVLALRALVDTLSLRLSVDAHCLVDEDWDRVFGGVNTGTPRSRAVRRELCSFLPLPSLHYQGTPDLALVCADRVVDPAVPFELTGHDIAHLIVTRGEHSYEIGPLVVPGVTPCYHCCEHARAQEDPFHLTNLRELAHWPLAPLPLLTHFAAALRVARLLRDFASGGLDADLCSQIATVSEDGNITVERAAADPGCSCGVFGLAS